ncbi:MAG: amidohydrolase family protein [Clostridiaceae bacterium]|jgi:predicted TIM-barrel fold metal-dependent hydrolase|nr:amidohydrolase family protein [Clostridiaceae bacterium]
MPIDCHTHLFPDPLAPTALARLRQGSGGLKAWSDATVRGQTDVMARCGLEAAWVLNIATTPRQQRSVNDFAASVNSPTLIAFGSVHPQAPDACDELERMAALGLRGLKLHPYFQQFAIDDPRMKPIYRKAAALGLVTVFHVGYDIGFSDSRQAAPRALAAMLDCFGSAPVVAAHLGGSLCWQESIRYLAGQPVYLDTAFCAGRIPLPEACRLISRHGTGHLLFGSDLPWSDPLQELDFVGSLGLDASERQAVLSGNARRLLPV